MYVHLNKFTRIIVRVTNDVHIQILGINIRLLVRMSLNILIFVRISLFTRILEQILFLSRPFQEFLHDILYFDIIPNIEKKHIHLHLFELEHFKKHLIELEHLPEQLIELEQLPKHLIGELFGARTMT